jgi:hypothetical protein
VKLGIENRKELIVAAALGAVLLAIVVYEFMPSSSTNASTTPPVTAAIPDTAAAPRATAHRGPASAPAKKPLQNLDPMLNLDELASSEKIKYEGTGRNIFVAQADTEIPIALGTGATDHKKKEQEEEKIYQAPPPAPAPPIPLKFFGFASQPGEPKKIFLVKGEDVFIAGEGEVVDRRYKVVKITTSSVDIQDVVGSGPPQSIPLTQG